MSGDSVKLTAAGLARMTAKRMSCRWTSCRSCSICVACNSAWAVEKQAKISTFRERGGIEVDFIVEIEDRTYAIEVKTNENMISDDLEGLKFFEKNVPLKKQNLFIWHMGNNEIKRGNIWILPWQKGLQEIGL